MRSPGATLYRPDKEPIMIFDYCDVKSLALDIDLDANTVKLTDATLDQKHRRDG